MTRICGLVPNSTELDEAFAAMMLRTTAEDAEREAQPQANSSDEESVHSEGFTIVCGLLYGARHSHNSAWRFKVHVKTTTSGDNNGYDKER